MSPKISISQPKLPEFIALVALITSLVALSIDAMLPALPDIAIELGVEDARYTQWIITSLILGMSAGQMLFGPLSDRFGRKIAILSGIVLFCVGSVMSMTANNLTVLLAGRLLQGIGVSGPRIASMALVRDQYAGDAMARVMSFVMMVFILVPMLAPAIGQAILWVANWRYIFGLFIVLSLFAGLWLALRQPETLQAENRRRLHPWLILATTWEILRNPAVMAYAVASGFVFGGLLAYVATSQGIFQDIYGLGDAFPFYFAALAFGVGLSSLVNGTLVMKLGARHLSELALIGLIIFGAILTLLAYWQGGNPALEQFMVLGFAMFFCVGILFGNLNSLAMLPLGKMAGIGAAVIGSVSNVVAVAASSLIGWFFTQSVLPIIVGIMVCGVCALCLMWWVKRQPAIQEAS